MRVYYPKQKFKYTSKSIYKYDNKRNIVEELKYYSDGSLRSKSIYKIKYNDKGNKVEEGLFRINKKTLRTNDTPVWKHIYAYIYDQKGNIIEVIRYNKNKQMDHIIRYDSKGNIIEYVNYNFVGPSCTKIRTTFKYDNNGNLIERTYPKSDGSPGEKTIRKLDNQGRAIEILYYIADGTLNKKTVLKYDIKEKGNSTEMFKYKWNEKEKKIELEEYCKYEYKYWE